MSRLYEDSYYDNRVKHRILCACYRITQEKTFIVVEESYYATAFAIKRALKYGSLVDFSTTSLPTMRAYKAFCLALWLHKIPVVKAWKIVVG